MNTKIIAAIAGLALTFPLASMAEAFKMPPVAEEEVQRQYGYFQGGKIDPATLAPSQRRLHGETPSAIETRLFWVGEGDKQAPRVTHVEQRRNDTIATFNFYFKPGDKFVLDHWDLVVKDQAGDLLHRESRSFSAKMWDYPDDASHMYTVPYALRTLDLATPGTEHNFNLWLPPGPELFPMRAVVKGTETVRLKDGSEYKCFRVEVFPDLIKVMGPVLGRAIGVFIGTYTFWYDVEAPHPMVKYTGPMGKVNSRGAPTEVNEIVIE